MTDSVLQAGAAEIGSLLSWIREMTWDVGGNPGELRSAAGSWRRLETDLHVRRAALTAASGSAQRVWKDEAAAAFGSYGSKVAAALSEMAVDCGKIASALDAAARKIDDANAELHGIYLQIGLMLGVDLALQWVPGVDIALDAATVARAFALVGRAGMIVAEVIAYLGRVVAQFAINTAVGALARGAERWVVTGNFRNLFQWTATDRNQWLVGSAVAALPGAVLGARGGLLLTSLPRLARFSVSLRGVRLPVGAILRAAEPYPTYAMTSATAGMAGSALNSLMDHRTPTWGQVLQAGAISAGLAIGGGGSVGFFSRLRARGPTEWPAEMSFGRRGKTKVPAFLRLESGEVLTPPMTVREWDLQMTAGGLYVRTASGAQRVRDLGVIRIAGGTAQYIPRYSGMRLPPGVEPRLAKWYYVTSISSALNFGFDTGFIVKPDWGAWVRHARHLTYPLAAPTPVEASGVHLLALPGAPPPGHLPRHVVRPGDTLWDIAARQYGNPFAYREIARRNRIANPDLIYPGEDLVLPAVLPAGSA